MVEIPIEMLNDGVSMNCANKCKRCMFEWWEKMNEWMMCKVDLDDVNLWNGIWKWFILS